MSIWKRIKNLYEKVPTDPIGEAYHYSSPLPTCEIKGCYEERYTQMDKGVYKYCHRHLKLIANGIAINCVCSRPDCNIDVLDSNIEMCYKHKNLIN